MGLCNKCAEIKGSCCINREIILTEKDLERIGEYSGNMEFYQYSKPENPEYLDQDDDPNWNDYTVYADGTRRILKRKTDKKCVFLSETGCTLPLNIRPLLCRIFPIIYNEEGITGIEPDCPAELLEPGEDLFTILNMNEEIAEQWRQQLYKELAAEKMKKQDMITSV